MQRRSSRKDDRLTGQHCAAPTLNFRYEGSPPSKSNFRKSGNDWRKKWQRLKEFEAEVGWLARAAGARVRNEPAGVYIEASNVRLDLDNICKATVDALCGVAIADDDPAHLESVHVVRRDIPGFTGLNIQVDYIVGDVR